MFFVYLFFCFLFICFFEYTHILAPWNNKLFLIFNFLKVYLIVLMLYTQLLITLSIYFTTEQIQQLPEPP